MLGFRICVSLKSLGNPTNAIKIQIGCELEFIEYLWASGQH